MAFSIVQLKRFVQSGTDVTSWAATFDNPTVSTNTLVAVSTAEDSSFDVMTGMSLDDGGTNTWQSVSQSNLAGGGAFIRVGMFYVPNCTGKTTHTVTVTPTASAPGFLGQGDLFLIELGNMLSASLDGTAATPGTGTATPAVSGALTASAGGIHVSGTGFRGNGGTPTFTPAAGWNTFSGGDPAAQFGTYVMYRAAVATVSQTPSLAFTLSPFSDGWAGLHAVFLESVSGGTVYVPIEMVS